MAKKSTEGTEAKEEFKIMGKTGEPELLTQERHPNTFKFIEENRGLIVDAKNPLTKESIRDHYFYGDEYKAFKEELVEPEYNELGMTVFLNDFNTVSFQIRKLI